MRCRSLFHSLNPLLRLAAALAVVAGIAVPPPAAADGVELMAAAPRPVTAPAIELGDLNGTPFSLAARKGRVTLVNFWALWCAPCRAEMPALARFKERMAGRGLEVAAVNLGDKPENIRRFLDRIDARGLTIPLDRTGQTGRDWHVQGLPATFLIGSDGAISHVALGARDWDSDGALRWFESALAKAVR